MCLNDYQLASGVLLISTILLSFYKNIYSIMFLIINNNILQWCILQ